MKVAFWSSLSFIVFAYAGYPILLYIRARYWPRPVRRANITPTVTIVLAVHNEEQNLPVKLHNLAALDYPEDRLEVVVVSDGSTDETNNILASWKNQKRHIVVLPRHLGKAIALNSGVSEAHGEILVFVDARQVVAPDALKNLVANFADPAVGCVSGELIIGENVNSGFSGVGLYWRLEKTIRKWESCFGSTVGATGALYAVRRGLFVPIPENTILDDVYIPLQVARQGQRVIFEPCAQVLDYQIASPGQEFRRKVRTLTGNYQLLQLAPWVLTRSNPLRLQFICHKLFRLLVPFGLAGVFISTLSLRSGAYEFLFVFQLAFYALAAARPLGTKTSLLSKLSNIALAFVVLNAAAAVALINFVTGRRVVWAR